MLRRLRKMIGRVCSSQELDERSELIRKIEEIMLIREVFPGYAGDEFNQVEAVKKLDSIKSTLIAFNEFVDSISYYVGNYPAWKAQSEYREVLNRMGHPLSGQGHKFLDGKPPTHQENVDGYLGRVVDAFVALREVVPGKVPRASSIHWDKERLGGARGDYFLTTDLQGPEDDSAACATGER